MIGLLAAFTVGFIAGDVAGCGAPCEFNTPLFDAIGTWVGGVLVAGAVAVYTVLSSRRAREKAAAAAEREARALALMCTIRFVPKRGESHKFSQVHIEFTNKLAEIVSSPRLVLEDGTDLGSDEQVWPERSWGKSTSLRSIGLDDSYATEIEAREAINRDGRSAVRFEYTVGDYRFARTRDVVVPIKITAQRDRPRQLPAG